MTQGNLKVDLQFSDADISFREEVRTWLKENAPRDRPHHDRQALTEYDINWQKIQWDGGYAELGRLIDLPQAI